MNLLLATISSYALITPSGASVTTLTVPSGKVSSNLTRFPMRIDLADMPSAFWNTVSEDGGNIRVTTSTNADVPIDIVSIDLDARKGELFALVSVSATEDTVFKVRTSPDTPGFEKTDANGQYAVWSDFKAMYVMGDQVDRTGINGTLTTEGDIVTAGNNFAVSAKGPLVNCHQGVAYDGTYYYTVHTNVVQKRDANWNIVTTRTLATSGLPSNVNHFGDACIWGDYLVVTAEQYTNNPYNSQYLVCLNRSNLTVADRINISAGLHELSSVVYHPGRDRFFVTDFTAAGNSVLHIYTTAGVYEGVFTLSSPTTLKQGISYHDGKFYLSGGPGAKPTIHSVDDTTGEVQLEWTGSLGAAIEGLHCLDNGDLLVLFDGNDISNVFTFTKHSGKVPGWLNLNGFGNGRVNDIVPTTAWTMGASIIPKSLSPNGTLMSWSEAITENTARASLVARLIGNFGVWNSTDTWLNAVDVAVPQVDVRSRLHHTQNGTANRKIYVNGILGASQDTVSARPSANSRTVFIGAEDLSYAERVRGALNYVYVRSGESSAALLKAEYDSWEANDFYSVGEPA